MGNNIAFVIFLAITAFAMAAVVVALIRTRRQRPVGESITTPPADLVRKSTYRYRLGDRVEFWGPGQPVVYMSGRVSSRTIWKGYPHYRVTWDNGYASGPLDLTDYDQWTPEALLNPEVVVPPVYFPLVA